MTTPRLGPNSHQNMSQELWCRPNRVLSQISQRAKIRSLKPLSTYASKSHLLPEVPEALFQRARQLHGAWGFFALNMTRYGLTDLILQTQLTDFGLSFSVPLLMSGNRHLWKTSRSIYRGPAPRRVRCKHMLSAR